MITKSDTDDKIVELKSRIISLEESYDRDIRAILEILTKLEKKVAGGGLDSDEIGLIMEVRDLKKEMSNNKEQLEAIEKNVNEIKNSIIDTKQLTLDVTALKLKIEKYDKYKYLILGSAMTVGWLMGNIGNIINLLKNIL